MLRTIHLYGRLSKFGPKHRYDVLTLGESVRALNSQIEGFDEEIRKGAYEVIVGDRAGGMHLGEEEINGFNLGAGDIHIIPVAQGAKKGGLLKIILGVALIGASLFLGPMAGALGFANVIGMGVTAGNLGMLGLGLVMAGASSLLTPTKKTEKVKKDESFSIQGPGNTYDQGQPVPLVYGFNVITGSHLISASIDIEDYKKTKENSEAQVGDRIREAFGN